MMKSEVIKTSQAIANLSDQVEGYSQEIARTVMKISEQYDVSKEFALLIVQTGILLIFSTKRAKRKAYAEQADIRGFPPMQFMA